MLSEALEGWRGNLELATPGSHLLVLDDVPWGALSLVLGTPSTRVCSSEGHLGLQLQPLAGAACCSPANPTVYPQHLLQTPLCIHSIPCKPNRAPTAPPENLTVHPPHTQLCTHSTSCKPALLQLHPGGKPLRSASVLRVQNSDNPGAIYFFVCCLALLLLSLFFF